MATTKRKATPAPPRQLNVFAIHNSIIDVPGVAAIYADLENPTGETLERFRVAVTMHAFEAGMRLAMDHDPLNDFDAVGKAAEKIGVPFAAAMIAICRWGYCQPVQAEDVRELINAPAAWQVTEARAKHGKRVAAAKAKEG